MTWTARMLAGLAIVCAARTARADDAIATGAVIKIEQREIYISLGDGHGVTGGASIRIKRTIRLKHPVTRAAIEDWIPIGSATVTQAASRMSRAVVGELVQSIRVGDIAEVLIERAEPPPSPPPSSPSSSPPPRPVDPATGELLAAFTAQTGASLDARIAAWEGYLSSHAGSPHAAAIRQDLAALRALRDEVQPTTGPVTGAPIAAVEHAAPARADAGTAIPVVFVLEQPAQVASAYLHYRTRDRRTFQRALLAREHDLYLRGAIPGDAVKAPGVDYFVEVSAPNGMSGLAVGSPARPIRVEVAPPTLRDRFDDDTRRRTHLALSGEYLDVATFDRRDGDRRDVIYLASAEVSYELDSPVQRVGIGYGLIAGIGGFTDAVDSPDAPLPRAGFHYGQAAVELGSRWLAVGGKLIAGVGRNGFGGGLEGSARLGARDATSVALSARRLPEVGWAADLRLGSQPRRGLLLGVRVGATDQPNRGDVAAKLASEVEWIGWSNPSSLWVRVSWQGRSILHGGIGGGAGIGFTW